MSLFLEAKIAKKLLQDAISQNSHDLGMKKYEYNARFSLLRKEIEALVKQYVAKQVDALTFVEILTKKVM